MRVDNTALETFICPAKYDLRINRGIVPLRRKPSLSFGGVMHKGWAEWYRTGSEAKALLAIQDHWPEVMPSDDFRTKAYACTVMHAYVAEYPEESWTPVQTAEGPLVEKAFTIDTGLFLECQECGGYAAEGDYLSGKCSNCGHDLESILYGGIIDVGMEFGDTLYVVDHKTTTVLGKEDSNYYFLQYKPDNQMTGYIWGLKKLSNRRVGGALINAVGLYKSGEVRFKRQITARNDFEITEWLKTVLAKCNAIKKCERTGIWPLETKYCMHYGQCDYHSVHVLNDPVSREKRIEQDYVVSKWNYEERDD
jgi:PD-(D/E)XK nuclease superfamily protein